MVRYNKWQHKYRVTLKQPKKGHYNTKDNKLLVFCKGLWFLLKFKPFLTFYTLYLFWSIVQGEFCVVGVHAAPVTLTSPTIKRYRTMKHYTNSTRPIVNGCTYNIFPLCLPELSCVLQQFCNLFCITSSLFDSSKCGDHFWTKWVSHDITLLRDFE